MKEILESASPPGFKFTTAWIYRDADGNGLGVMARYDATVANGKRRKTFKPFVQDGDTLVCRGFPEPRPLYGLDRLAARGADPVLVVEGEKVADIAQVMFDDYVVITSPHGAQSAKKADWAPLEGRDVTIWPDHDAAGSGYALDVRDLVPQAKVVTVPAHYPIGWDLADNAPGGAVDSDLLDMIQTAGSAPAAPKTKKKANGKAQPGNGTEALRESIKPVVAEIDAEKLADAPSLDETLRNVSSFMGRFICYPSENARIAHTLWIAHCHLMEAWYTTPRLAFMSAEKASGKTRALEVTELLVPNPILSINASPAAIVTHVSGGVVTILHDEIDNVFGSAKSVEANADLCAILNGGYRRGAAVYRCIMQGKTRELEKLEAFCPVAIAGLKTLPDTLASRSIFVRMRRRAPGEQVEQFRQRQIRPQAQALFDALALRCREIERAMTTAEPKMPDSIMDRDAECWEPLFAVADAAGGDWPKMARTAATELIKGAVDAVQSEGTELLEHVREEMGGEEKIWTLTLLNRLHNRDESPWMDVRGRPLTDRGLAERLKPYGVRSRVVRIGEKTLKGFYASDLHEAWNIYLPPLPEGNKGNKGHNIDNVINNVTDVTHVTPGEAGEVTEEGAMTDADNDPFDVLKDKDLIPESKNRHSSSVSEPGTKVPAEVTLALLRGDKV